MASPPDTLTATGAPVALAAPDSATFAPQGYTYTAAGYVALPGLDEVAVIYWGRNATTHNVDVAVAGYGLGGGVLFQDAFAVESFGEQSWVIGALPGGPIAIGYELVGPGAHFGQATVDYATITPTGSVLSSGYFYPAHVSPGPLNIQPAGPESFKLVWDAHASGFDRAYDRARETQYFGADGQPVNGLQTDADLSIPPVAQAVNTASGTYVLVTDNALEFHGPGAVQTTGIPNEPAHAITGLAAAALADSRFAVAWADSGTDYVSVYDSATNSFGPVIGLDWGGASDLHIAALADGGFAISWVKSGAYQGEVFDSAGNGGGIISLAGDVAGIDSHGDLYTVGLNSGGAYVVQTYAVNGGSGGSGGSTGGGQTYTSDNAGDHWTGTAGNDTFNLGRGGDVVTGNGGDDTFKFAETPWAGGHITDFSIGDKIDLLGLLHASGYTGNNPWGDGYLKLTTDSQGNGQIWSDVNQSGNSGWWLVTTVDGVSSSRLQLTGFTITEIPPPNTAVATSDPTYTAPSYVSSITLTGSGQTVRASSFDDTTIWSNNTGNTIYGASGDDIIHIGRGGDTVTGGAGRDVFVFDETPWAPATIKDFDVTSGDSIDVRGLLAKAGYTGSDPIADGYLKIANGQLQANYHQPGNDGWWVVATGVVAPTPIVYDNGIIHGADAHVGGTYTGSTAPLRPDGYDTIVLTGSNTSIGATDGGVTLVDEGSNNALFGRQGNDTFILSPTTTSVDTSWGGFDTIVLNAHPAVTTTDTRAALNTGDRIDLHPLLQGMGYTGSDPIADGYIKVDRQPQAFGQMAPNDVHIWFDPDGPGGGAPWTMALDLNGFTPNPHYSDGWLIV